MRRGKNKGESVQITAQRHSKMVYIAPANMIIQEPMIGELCG